MPRKDALDYHILVTLLCKVSCRVAAMWVQGSSDVTTSWSGLVALPAPDYYNGHPLLTTYKTCYEAYISLNGELNALGYFNLAVIVHSVEYGHVTYTCTWPRARPISRSRHVYKVGSAHLPFYKKLIKILLTYTSLINHTCIRSTEGTGQLLPALHTLVTLSCRVTRMWSHKFHQVLLQGNHYVSAG